MEVRLKNGKIVKKMSTMWHFIFGILLLLFLFNSLLHLLNDGNVKLSKQNMAFAIIVGIVYLSKYVGDTYMTDD